MAAPSWFFGCLPHLHNTTYTTRTITSSAGLHYMLLSPRCGMAETPVLDYLVEDTAFYFSLRSPSGAWQLMDIRHCRPWAGEM